MSDDDPVSAEEREEIERVKVLCLGIDSVFQTALEHASFTEKRLALAMALAQICLKHDHPDSAFLEALDGALAVFRDMTNTLYRNQDPRVS